MRTLRDQKGARPLRSKSRLPLKRQKQRAQSKMKGAKYLEGAKYPEGAKNLGGAKYLVGRDLAKGKPHRRIPIWMIPGIVVGAVFAALALVHVRVELIGQGYKRYSAVERLQVLEEEKRNLTAHVRELRDPTRLAKLAREMGLSRPDRVIALAPPGDELRP